LTANIYEGHNYLNQLFVSFSIIKTKEGDTMKNRTLFLPVLVISLLVLTACGGNQVQQQTKGVFLGGTQGISANFEAFGVAEGGIYSIFDTETFPIEVTVRNKGEYDLKASDVTVELAGIDKSEISNVPSWQLKNKGTIEKISELTPSGGEETISFGSDAKYLPVVTGAMERKLFANLDFNYQTYLIIPEVCLKEDLKDTRICNVKEKKNFFVSGAPITVTSVDEETAGQAIMALKIKIKNAGTGKVAKPNEDFTITDKLTYSMDDNAWECKSTGKVNEARLDKGEAEIICKLKQALSKGTLSTKQVKMTFDYKYRDMIQEKIQIKQSTK